MHPEGIITSVVEVGITHCAQFDAVFQLLEFPPSQVPIAPALETVTVLVAVLVQEEAVTE